MAYDLSAANRYSVWHPILGRGAALASVLGLLGGCATLGSESIVVGRTPVNEAVATTSRQQTLMNIVRVYHNEPPVILDVVEADEAVSLGASGTGGVSAIGAIPGAMGRSGSASATVSAADAVTNRYIPLQGQALISQLSSQITVETLNALYDSDWPLQSILEFAVDRISRDQGDYDVVRDALTFLDANHAISLATAKSGFSNDPPEKNMAKIGSVTINTQPPAAGGGDTLNVYFTPKITQKSLYLKSASSESVWLSLYKIYDGTQPNNSGKTITSDQLTPGIIELRNSPRTHFDKKDGSTFFNKYLGPIMRTRTAIGILKFIVTQPDVAFISPSEYQFIKTRPWNGPEYFVRCPDADSYVLDPDDLSGHQINDHELFYQSDRNERIIMEKANLNSYIKQISMGLNNYVISDKNTKCFISYISDRKYEKEIRNYSEALASLRRYILIVKSQDKPTESFSTWYDGNMYYSIMSDDRISQRNLMLISQFLTIQSTSTPSPSLTTVSASGH